MQNIIGYNLTGTKKTKFIMAIILLGVQFSNSNSCTGYLL